MTLLAAVSSFQLKSTHTEVGFCKMLFLRHIQVHGWLTCACVETHICLWFHGTSTSNVQLVMQKYLSNSYSIEKNRLLLFFKEKERNIISLRFFCFYMPERDLLRARALPLFSLGFCLLWCEMGPLTPALLTEAVTSSTEFIWVCSGNALCLPEATVCQP